MKNVGANVEDIASFLSEIKIPVDEITLNQLAEQILSTEITIGYLTI